MRSSWVPAAQRVGGEQAGDAESIVGVTAVEVVARLGDQVGEFVLGEGLGGHGLAFGGVSSSGPLRRSSRDVVVAFLGRDAQGSASSSVMVSMVMTMSPSSIIQLGLSVALSWRTTYWCGVFQANFQANFGASGVP